MNTYASNSRATLPLFHNFSSLGVFSWWCCVEFITGCSLLFLQNISWEYLTTLLNWLETWGKIRCSQTKWLHFRYTNIVKFNEVYVIYLVPELISVTLRYIM